MLYSVLTACDSNPCQNNGSCNSEGPGLFTCTCERDVYTGVTCEQGIALFIYLDIPLLICIGIPLFM